MIKSENDSLKGHTKVHVVELLCYKKNWGSLFTKTSILGVKGHMYSMNKQNLQKEGGLLTICEGNGLSKAVEIAFRSRERCPASGDQGPASELEADFSVENFYCHHVVGKVNVDEVKETGPAQFALRKN